MPIVVNINLSARAKPRAAEALRRAGYEIEEFEGLSEPISLTGKVMDGAYEDRLLIGLDKDVVAVISNDDEEMVAIGTIRF